MMILLWILPADFAGTQRACATFATVRYPQSDRAACSTSHHLCHAACISVPGVSEPSVTRTFVNLTSTDGLDVTSRAVCGIFDIMCGTKEFIWMLVRDPNRGLHGRKLFACASSRSHKGCRVLLSVLMLGPWRLRIIPWTFSLPHNVRHPVGVTPERDGANAHNASDCEQHKAADMASLILWNQENSPVMFPARSPTRLTA